MKIKVYVLDIPFPPWARSLSLVAVSVGAFGLGIALAAPSLKKWAMNDTLRHDDLNGNFAALATVTNGAKSYSVGPTKFCGTSTNSMGNAGGYKGVKNPCEAAGASCSSTAHACTTDEILRNAAIGVAIPAGNFRFASGPLGSSPDDCAGFTQTSGRTCEMWSTDGANVQNFINGNCTDSVPFLCCD